MQRLQPEEGAYLLERRVGKEELRAKLKTAFRHSEEARKTVSKRKFSEEEPEGRERTNTEASD